MTSTVVRTTRADQARFVALAATWTLLLFALLRTPWFVAHAVFPLVSLQQAVAAWYGGRSPVPVVVTLECSGTDVCALCAGVILAYPVAWRRRARGVAIVLPVLLLLNIVRIGTLSIAAASPGVFNALHSYVWPGLLIATAAALIFAWMRSIGIADRSVARAGKLALFCLGAFAVAVPWAGSTGLVSSACGFVAGSASWVMHALGADAVASGPVLTTPRGAFMVTADCLLSPVIPLWVLAVFWWPLSRWERVAGLVLTVPVIAGLAVTRLLVLAAPGAWIQSPLILVHGFHQIVLFVALVMIAAARRSRMADSRFHGATRGLQALALAAVGAAVIGPSYNALIVLMTAQLVPWAPHAQITLLPATDIQGALALLPIYQVALLVAMVWSFGRPVRWVRLTAAMAGLCLSQVALLVVLGETSAHFGIRPHALVLRGWAVCWPVVLAFVALRRADVTVDVHQRDAAYRTFWDRVGAEFPDLGEAASTRFYFENEKRLIGRHLGHLDGRRVLKTDLWDEARNTRILQWVQRQGATVVGVDISGPVVRAARAEFNGAPLVAAGADVRALPFFDSSFDAVYSMGTIEHFPESDRALCEIYRVLKPGGRAIVGVPNRHDPFLRPLMVAILHRLGLYAYGREKSYSRKSLRRLLGAAGFAVVGDDAILFIPGWLRMLDLFGHTRCSPLARLTAIGVRAFAWIDRHVPAVRRHGYLVVATGERPGDERREKSCS
jgi:exosortase/archaeosortase family protein